MSIGPIFILYICQISKDGILHTYRLFLESVTVRFKLAQLLGLADEQESSKVKLVWGQEPILPSRHIPVAQSSKSSPEWIENEMRRLPSLWFSRIFKGASTLSIIMLIAILILAYLSYKDTANKELNADTLRSTAPGSSDFSYLKNEGVYGKRRK